MDESGDTYDHVPVEEIKFYPHVFDFLLPQFPHTMCVKLNSDFPEKLWEQLTGWIEFEGPESEGTIRMRPHQEGGRYLLEGAFCPPTPGAYRFRIILEIAGQRFVVTEGERDIIAPLEGERWTQEPIAIQIEEWLFLGNVAAAASPQFLERIIRTGHQEIEQIAVLNASEEREPRPALFSAQTEMHTAFNYKQFPFTDFSHNPMNKEQLWKAVRWIHEQRAKGPVFVHCHAGIGRSASLIVAYLRLFLRRNESFDQIVSRFKEVVKNERHSISPHSGLAETLKELQEEDGRQKELAKLLGLVHYDFFEEPSCKVNSLSFSGGYEVGQTIRIFKDERILIQARIEYEGCAPHGVFVLTNLSGEERAILMRRVEGNLYQAEVAAMLEGDNFWLTVFATPRLHDHFIQRQWIGGNLLIDIEETMPRRSRQ